jgi:PIF1-like helicase/Helix-turn-helix domain/HRDC domain/Helicase
MATDTSNINFQLAADFINYTNRSVFLTGKAGTGKTTFLKYIKEHSIKQMAVVAPTGVAAINAGGVTIHSFFQLPFTPYVPERKGFSSEESMDKHHLIGRLKINGERRKIFQQLELLVIDEISMVRADVLDAIDVVLRHFRSRYNEPFGGVQMLLIGDMFQLPPVVPDAEWAILSQHYTSPYFFSSKVMEERTPAYVELNKIYRQSDERFIDVLNQVRNNELDENGYEILHEHYAPSFTHTKEDGFITLTTHNYKADAINADELAKLTTPLYAFKAEVQQEFGEKSYPADEVLHLRIGAQVMFMKNDMDKAKRYFNGKIGVVENIEADKIFVQCKGEAAPIEVKKYKWENIRYSLNKQSQQVEEDVVGAFTQYPLRLAWAITIHKSQGLTFEKAIIDAGKAFAPGQVYVALSRCTTLDGMVLLSKISASSLHSDPRILAFSNNQHKAQLPQALQADKHLYQSKLIMQLFNFSAAQKQFSALLKTVEDHNESFNNETVPYIQDLEKRLIALQEVYQKFENHLQQLLQQVELPEHNPALQERIKKAAIWFDEQLQGLLKFILASPAVTDSKQYSMAYNEDIKDLFALLAQQAFNIKSCVGGFSVDGFHESKKNFVLPYFNVNAYAGANTHKKVDSPHPELHKQLRQLRDKICERNGQPIYIVASTVTLDEMARYLPQNLEELRKISGFGDAKIEKYGLQFLDIIQRYCNEHDLPSLIHEKVAKRERKEKTTTTNPNKKDSKLESFTLFREGKSVAEIAAARNFAVQTIEGHLAHFVSLGEIKIDELVSREKIIIIEPALDAYDKTLGLTPLKEKLGSDITYGEIRLVVAWKEFEKNNQVV